MVRTIQEGPPWGTVTRAMSSIKFLHRLHRRAIKRIPSAQPIPILFVFVSAAVKFEIRRPATSQNTMQPKIATPVTWANSALFHGGPGPSRKLAAEGLRVTEMQEALAAAQLTATVFNPPTLIAVPSFTQRIPSISSERPIDVC